mgnify:FL=1
MKKPICILCFIIFISGCVSNPKKHNWNPEDSEALNIATAAGIDGLKDYKTKPDEVDLSKGLNSLDIAYAASNFSTPPPGFTGWSSLSLFILSDLFSPDARAARNSFFYWDSKPKNKKDFYTNFINIMEKAKTAYEKSGGKYELVSSHRGHEKKGMLYTLNPYWSVNLNGHECSKGKIKWACLISFDLGNIVEGYPPRGDKPVLHTDVSASRGYTKLSICLKNEQNYKLDCSYIYRRKTNYHFNELEFLTEFSKFLPEDFYIYIAPKRAFLDKQTPLKIPVILNKGRLLYFIN